MNIEDIREYCLALPYAEESMPFGEEVLVFKIKGKMFAIVWLSKYPQAVNLKCEATYAVELREKYEAVAPGYHMNKKYWNTVYLESGLPDELLKELIQHSYKEVIKKLPKKQQITL